MNHIELGRLGEEMAVNLLLEKNYTILERNYRFGKLELDIIAKYKGFLIVIEVKTRFTNEIGEPWEAVTKKKQTQIIKATNHYIIENDIDSEVRFDVISIIKNEKFQKIEHIIDAFTS
jgi:putative endonuclease